MKRVWENFYKLSVRPDFQGFNAQGTNVTGELRFLNWVWGANNLTPSRLTP